MLTRAREADRAVTARLIATPHQRVQPHRRMPFAGALIGYLLHFVSPLSGCHDSRLGYGPANALYDTTIAIPLSRYRA